MEVERSIEAVWRIERPRLVAALARLTRDLSAAEELAQDALVAALERWPEAGVPDSPGGWLMATARRRAIDLLRRRRWLEERQRQLEAELGEAVTPPPADDDGVGDDLLRLMLAACHPVLSPEARVALTLRLLGGLTTEEIARAFLVPEPTIAQRIVRAKRALAEARVPFSVPQGAELAAAAGRGAAGDLPGLQRGLRRHRRRRLGAAGALRGGAAAGAGAGGARCRRRPRSTGWWRCWSCRRPGSAPGPGRPASRSCSSTSSAAAGTSCSSGAAWPRWRGPRRWAVRPAPTRCRPASPPATPGPAPPGRPTGPRIVALYGALAQAAPSPVVELNRAVAVSMAFGPAAGLALVDAVAAEPALQGYHLLPAVRGDLLLRLGRRDEARAELLRAAALARNGRERALLEERAARLDAHPVPAPT